jgi:hypothetical protein
MKPEEIKKLTGIGEIMNSKEQKRKIEDIIKRAIHTRTKKDKFKKELECLINKHSIDSAYHCQDFILVDYIMNCLEAFGDAVGHKRKMSGGV